MLYAVAATTAGKTIASAGSNILHALDTYDHEKDEHRQATNQRAANLAQRGVLDAWRYLGMRGDVLPAGTIGPLALDGVVITPGGLIDGWASPPAREDAAAKYRALAPSFNGVTVSNPGGNRGDVGGIDPLTGQPMAPPVQAGIGGNGALLIVLAIGAILLLANAGH